MKILLTGIAGTGKSTIVKALSERGIILLQADPQTLIHRMQTRTVLLFLPGYI